MSATKRKYAYPGAKPFDNEELWQIIQTFKKNKKTDDNGDDESDLTKKSWLSFDVKNENQNAMMKKKGVRYVQMLVTDLSGKVRPLIRKTTIDYTRSQVKSGVSEEEEQTTPGKASFSTRILATSEDQIPKLAKDYVKEQNPDLALDGAAGLAKIELRTKIFTQCLLQWRVEQAINDEFLRLISDKEYTDPVLDYVPGNGETISGNVQYGRKPIKGDKNEKKLADRKTGLIPLDQFMVYKHVRIDKNTGEIWAKIYDMTETSKDGSRKLATVKNRKGQSVPLTYNTLTKWLRYGSAFTGISKYTLGISSRGARLNEQMTELAVRRSSKTESQSKLDSDGLASLAELDDDFNNDEDEDDDEPVKKTKKKTEDSDDDEEVIKKSKKKNRNDSDDEDEPIKKSKKKVDDSDEDEPVKKSKKKAKDDSDDEDDEPVKKSKKKVDDSDDDEPVKKSKKKAKDDSDDEDEESAISKVREQIKAATVDD